MDNAEIQKQLKEKGHISELIDPALDLEKEIRRLKKEKNAVILSHFYVDGELQDIADFVGDSLQLAREAEKTKADIIVFVGVHFMAETAKIINPGKKVLLPDLNASCSLDESAPYEKFRKFRKKYPDHKVISYINCSAALKTLTDVVCTSSNALQIVESFSKDEKIIFAPDKNLGGYINELTGRKMVLWDGSCMVHDNYSFNKISLLLQKYEDADVIAHPECEKRVLSLAKHIGSTCSLLAYVQKSPVKRFIIATEIGIIHQMKKVCPDKIFIPAPSNDSSKACDNCYYMKLNTMAKLYNCLKYELPEVKLSEEVMNKARNSIFRMLEISK